LTSECFLASTAPQLFRNIIQQNCSLLILQAAIENQKWFSAAHLKKIEPHSPFQFPYWSKLGKKIRKKYYSFQGQKQMTADDALGALLAQWGRIYERTS
jgi:hypothetical protein